MKDYKKILEDVVNIINTTENSDIGFANICTYIGENCPELKESKDERIRKSILNYLTKMWGSSQDDVYGVNVEDVIAWLERQAKRNPADKAESKFKVGDWCIDNEDGTVFQIVKVLDKTYRYRTNEGKEYSYSHYSLELDARLWTIQDAKDGDILHSTGFHNDCIFIFNGLDNWKFDEPNGDRAVATGYCCLSVSADNMEFGMQGPDCVEVNTVKPATKIQRDLLFRKIKEAGYEWDAEKKELKKIEHKPTWSEEDESNFQMLIDVIKENKHHATDYEHMKYYKLLSWFKSLKERVLPRQKQEWSEDDRARLQRVINFLIRNRKGDTDTIYQQEQDIDWLKAIKDRYVWKPSDEQMKALDWALSIAKNCGNECAFELRTLREQLKKLKG